MTDPTEVAAFLRAIIERPGDDLPRLVFADYLDERGNAERAEFIRVQVRIAQLERNCLCVSCVRKRGGGQHHNGPCAVDKDRVVNADGSSRQAMLRRRERELSPRILADFYLACGIDHTVRMEPRIFSVRSQIPAFFVRGFVEEITCSWSDWQRHADAIRAATPLRVVRLTTWPQYLNIGWKVDDADVSFLAISYPDIRFEFSETVEITP